MGQPARPVQNTYDDRLNEVNELVPGFGGMFLDNEGNLKVYIDAKQGRSAQARAAQKTQAEAALLVVFGKKFFDENTKGLRQAPRSGALGVNLEIITGQYNLRDLARWRNMMARVHELPGTSFTDLDERQNRLRIGLEDSTSRAEVEAALARAGVPLEAVIIEEGVKPFVFYASLTDHIRPTRGGTQLESEAFADCTLGFSAYQNGIRRFVTNAHCTATHGAYDGDEFHQASAFSSSDIIGVEVSDPGFFTSIWSWVCPWGRRCRYSDAALMGYYFGVEADIGKIARPLTWNTGTLQIDSAKPTFDIVGEIATPVHGSYLDKVGQITGWTYGQVTGTCMNMNVGGTDITLKCQNKVSRTFGNHTMADHGDSGSPVFAWYGNTVGLAGIVWGGNGDESFSFSSMKYIEQELGELMTYGSPPPPSDPGDPPPPSPEPPPCAGCNPN